jgi:RNA polymerase sigma factor (sigma-70 family)
MIIPLTEQDIIRDCLRGDQRSQKLLFNRFAGKMLTVCRRYARSEQEAEDMLQDTFVKVFSNLAQFQHKGSFEGWIRKITVNTALKHLEKNKWNLHESFLEKMPDHEIEPSALEKLQEEDLMKLISTLPDGYRAVFNLYVIDGFNHHEIAESLGIQESTSRSQLVKARLYLQHKIAEFYQIKNIRM